MSRMLVLATLLSAVAVFEVFYRLEWILQTPLQTFQIVLGQGQGQRL